MKARAILYGLIFIVIIIVGFFTGESIATYQKTQAIKVPEVCQGYFLTEFKDGNNVYDHILHISNSHLTTSNGIRQINNINTYDSSNVNRQVMNAKLDFKVKRALPMSHHRFKFIGYVTHATAPTTYFKHICKYRSFPPIYYSKAGVFFTHTGGIVKEIKLPKASFGLDGVRISKNDAKSIEINDNSNSF